MEPAHRIQCAWATCTCYGQELTAPTYPLLQLLTPSLLYALRTWTMTVEMKIELETNAKKNVADGDRRKEVIISNNAALTAKVDDDTNDEPRDPDGEPEEDTTEANPQDPNDKQESRHDLDINPFLASVAQDDEATEYEPEPWPGWTAHGIKPWIHKQSTTSWKKTDWLPNTTTAAGRGSLQSGAQRYRPNRNGARNADDQPKDGKTTSLPTYNQQKLAANSTH